MKIQFPGKRSAVFSLAILSLALASVVGAEESRPRWLSAGGEVIFNKASKIGSLTLSGGKVQGGIILSRKHFLGLELGSYAGDDSKETFGGDAITIASMDAGHSCCSQEEIAVMYGDGAHYTYSRAVQWRAAAFSYGYEFLSLPEKGVSLRAGPSLGVFLVKNKIKEHLMEITDGHHHTVYENNSDESAVAFAPGLDATLNVRFADGWFFEIGYRFTTLASHTSVKNHRTGESFKTGWNTSHHIGLAIGVRL